MAFNKSKNVEAAQKLLNQGKVVQAIAEYQHILKYEPRDQVTLMTIGELYIRQGETFQAIDYFERLAQIFVGDGFLTKAIAVYKRIAKLAPEEIRPLEKLADLYVQQGVMSEARPLFLQLAEIHLKNNRQPEAVGLLKKLLQAEPDNLRIQIRLADLYQAMGQTREAIEAYVSASQRALARGEQAESEKLADKVLKLEPNNAAAVIVKARSHISQGSLSKATQLLDQVSDLEKGGEQTELLLDLYVKNSNWDQAAALAVRVFEADQKNFGPMQKVVELLVQAGQGEKALGILEQARLPMIDAGEHELVAKLLNELAAGLPGRLEPLEWLVELYGRTSDSLHLGDALARLGDALAAEGRYQEAKKIFEQLVERQPESDPAKRKLNGVLRKMGLLEPEEAPEVPEEQEHSEAPQVHAPRLRADVSTFDRDIQPKPGPASPFEPQLDDETQKFISQSLTDVDLFASYGLTQKAIGLLEAILRRAPRHTPTLEKLLDFVLGAGDDRRTAELAAQLEQIHTETGDHRSAERFGELRRRFQRAAGMSDEELAAAVPASQPAASPSVAEKPAESTIPEIAATPVPHHSAPVPKPVAPPPTPEAKPQPVEANATPAAEPEVQEVDLSEEWDTLLEEAHPVETKVQAPPPPAKPAAPPARPKEPARVEEFHIAQEPTIAPPHDVPAVASAAATIPLEPVSKASAAPPPAKPKDKPAPPQKPPKPSEPEFELDQEYELVLEPEPLVPAYDQKPPQVPTAPPKQPVGQNKAAPPAGSGFDSDQFLADLAQEIDQLGMDSLAPTFSGATPGASAPSAPRKAAAPPSSGESGPLKEVFDEFRAELGEMGAEDEDLETHYNLGIAFREMGLLEEAISEFQKVAKANDRGRAFRYTMQCCTLLGLAFMEKGQPAIAAIWYERALKTPGMDPESTLALRYDLGVAQESAGEPEAALKSFSQVYAMNIDYRDVAERIAALQKPIR
ncbi:MAG TPA: tetratricopeptide repeat protein [Candidatus Acidoferrum sp.]|jgi:tetratricopeptide (TPR) repeat protein|nr:tetratricopeptide repeat protein [Candidatus Acidoferrum sp.]